MAGSSQGKHSYLSMEKASETLLNESQCKWPDSGLPCGIRMNIAPKHY